MAIVLGALLAAPSLAQAAPKVVASALPTSMTLGQAEVLNAKARVTGRTGNNAGAIVRFSLYEPDNPFCTAMPGPVETQTFAYAGSEVDVTTTISHTPKHAGTYKWVVEYSGDPDQPGDTTGCPDFNDNLAVDVSKASPQLIVTPSSQAQLGVDPKLTLSMRVEGRAFPEEPSPPPTHTVSWISLQLYEPNANGTENTACSPGNLVFSKFVPYPTAGGDVTTELDPYVPLRAGSYRWVAYYTGDANNTEDFASQCGQAGASTLVVKADPNLATVPSGTITLGSAGRLTDTVNFTGIVSPVAGAGAATVQFTLYGPDNLSCTGNNFLKSYTVGLSGNSATSPQYEPLDAGTYRWKAVYSGDANNSGETTPCTDLNSTIVQKATPTIDTNASDGFVFGTANAAMTVDADVMRVFPKLQQPQLVEFSLYGPDDLNCLSPTPLKSGALPYNGSTLTSPPRTPQRAGKYRWTVTYFGDTNNERVTTSCASGEVIDVAKRPTSIDVTAAGPIKLGVGHTLTLTAELDDNFELQANADMEFFVYGPNDPDCLTPLAYTSTVAYPTSGGEVESDPFMPHSPGTYRWIVDYSGDVNHLGPKTGCTGATAVSRAEPSLTTSASSEGVLGAGSMAASATMTGEFEPDNTAKVKFELFGPNDENCNGGPVFSPEPVAVDSSVANSPSFTPTRAGTYRWVATYLGDSNNKDTGGDCDADGDSVEVSKATTSIATTASPDTSLAGASLTAATLVTGRVTPTAEGTITFKLYGPNDLGCNNPPIFAPPGVAYPDAGEPAVTSPAFQPQRTGTYRWIASYSGDANNAAFEGQCNGPNQNTRVGGATAVLTTQASGDVVIGAGALTSTATLNGRVSPTAGATVAFTLYGPDDAACSRTAAFKSAPVTYPVAGGPVTSPAFSPGQTGVYRWVATYSGDENNVEVEGVCNAAASTVRVTGNTPTLAVTPSATTRLRNSITDRVVVNGRVSPVEGGVVDFRAYAPGDTACNRAPAFESLGLAYPVAGGPVTSGAFTPSKAGTYRWVVTYRGDANNAAAVSTCDTNNATSVTAPSPDRVIPNRAQTKRVIAHTTPRADPTKLYTFTTTGRIVLPGACSPDETQPVVGAACLIPLCPANSLDPADCKTPTRKLLCSSGRLTIRFIRISYTVSSRSIGLRPDCTFRSRMSLKSSSPFRRGQLTVRVRFEGNSFLLPKKSSRHYVRAGRSSRKLTRP